MEIAPAAAGSGIKLNLTSVVMQQFGDQIESVIRQTLDQLDVKDAELTVSDRGAVDCTIRARVETAVCRGKGVE